MLYELIFGTVAYAGGNGGLYYNNASTGANLADANDQSTPTQTQSWVQNVANSSGIQNSISNNAPIVYGMPTTGGNVPYTAGDGTLKITIYYLVIDL